MGVPFCRRFELFLYRVNGFIRDGRNGAGKTVGQLQASVSTSPEAQHAGQYTLKDARLHAGKSVFTKINNIVRKRKSVRLVSMPESS
jgi:hypothetical protein